MVIVEKCFPRGGTFTKSEQSSDNKFKDEPIFGTVQKKTKKRSANIDATSTPQDNEFEKKSKQTQADLISYETVQEGMLLMGVVRAIDPLGITVSLPGRMIARVSALDISNAYIKTTAKFVQNADDSKDYKPLTDLFRIGQIIYGRIEEIKQIETGIKHMKMTLKPSEVHKDLIHSSIKKGFVFNGAVEEIQEHGFIIETGIRGLRSFLPKAKSKDKEYATGQLVFLKVETVKNDKTATTVICKEVDDENLNLKSHADPNLDYILPTTIVQFKVSNILKDGLEGTIMGESLQAFASEHHLQNALMLPEDFEINSIHRARILYIMPITKQVYVTLNFEKVELISDDLENIKKPHYTRGDVVANAKVHHLGTGGIVFILDNQFKGIMTYKSVKAPFSGNYDHDQIVKKYTKKSKHTVRILGYDLVESTYTCTDEPAIVNEKFFVLEDVKPGDIVTGIVGSYDKQANAYIIRVGKLKGLLEEIYTAVVGKIQENAKIRCRVLSINKDRNTIYLTNRAEYMQKDVKMLADINEAKPKQVFTGTIVKTGSQFYLVKFFNGIQGFVYRNQLPSNISSTNQSFYEGQTMSFRIVENNQGKLTLTLPEDNFNIGEICPVIIKHVLDAGLEIEVNFKSNLAEDTEEDEEEMNLQKYNGFIPLNYLSDYEDLQIAKLSASKEGMSLTAACIGGNTFSIRDVSYFQVQVNNSWSTVKVGDILKANIKNVEDEVLELVLLLNNFEKSIKVHWKMLLQNINLKTNINFSANQVLYVKVLSKETTTKTLTVSAKLMDVWDGTLQYTADYAAKYLNEVETIKSNLLEKNEQLAAYELGEVVTATFSHIDSDTKNWVYSIENNSSNTVGVVRESFIRKTEIPKEGTQQKCVILWIDYSKNILYLSNKASDLAHISKGKQLPRNFIGKSGMSVKLLVKLESMLICSLKKGLNPIVICPNRLHDNDFENSVGANLIEGEFYKIAFIHDTLPIALPEDLWKIWKNKNLKRSATTSSVEELPAKKERLTKEEKLTISNKLQSQSIKDKPAAAKRSKSEKCVADKNKTKSVSSINDKEKPAANKKKIESLPFFEDIQVSSEKVGKKKDQNASSENLLIGVKDFWQSTTDSKGNEALDSSSEEEETDQHFNPFNSKSKKLTSTEKFKRSRQEESRLREIEEKFADPNQKPETVEQYERLVISDPNNSKNWINFMVHHLQLVEVEKARAIARRALKTISFKNTDNLINMWVALLNLELRYGTISNFDEAFKEALTCNDPLKIYLRVIDILISAKKTEKLIDLLNSILKKFKGEPEAWKAAADAYFQIDLPDKAQQMLHRALTCLPEREHVNTIVAFANLNYRHKRRDIAQTLYDQVVTSYPKRVDVWNQYIDMLIKDNLVDQARSVLDRAINQNIPMKKMRTIFKKLLDIETKFGSDADVERVKNMAAEYVKKNSNI